MIKKYKLLIDLEKNGYLKIIDTELDVNLEIPHIAYVEIKKKNPKVLLFTNPVDKEKGIKYHIPVLMNIFASYELTEKYLGRSANEIADEIEKLLKLKPPATFMGKIDMFKELFSLKSVFPKKINKSVQETHKEFPLDLEQLPILKTWNQDGGKFITMGQVYTHSLNGEISNIGMYRLQVYDKNHLGMHWQIHKDSNIFYQEFKNAKKKMPVTIVIGGDPLNTWVATAPLPFGVNEMLLYGFVKKENAKLIKSQETLFVPQDGDIIIEGFVEPDNLRVEGPFGDHTGYYTLEEEYPVMEVTSIRVKENPIYYATVVGKPPLEDKYMGWATERVFLPLLKTTAPDLIDYAMPENGVFHNLIIGKMKVRYEGHALQFMHSFWGIGQMSFVKHSIFVNENAPELENYSELVPYILNRFSYKDILVSKGILDALDHSSPKPLVGGKFGIDVTSDDEVVLPKIEKIADKLLLEQLRKKASHLDIRDLKTYFSETQNPITFLTVNKNGKSVSSKLDIFKEFREHIRILIIVDSESNSLDNLYMLLWRVVNNIDSQRDISMDKEFIVIDATNKIPNVDIFNREWPDDVLCDKDVLADLRKRNLIEIQDDFVEKFQLI